MKCSHIKKKLATLEPLTAAEAAHVHECPQCSAWLEDIEFFQSTPKSETPAPLKSHTLRMSLRVFEATPQTAELSFGVRLWNRPQTAFLMTGFSILALIVTVLYQLGCDGSDTLCQVSAIFLIIILAQNIIAALCMPLLLQFKNKLYYKW